MNTKEAIEVLNNHRKYTKYTLIDGELDGIIDLLQRGEKVEAMWQSLKYDICRMEEDDWLDTIYKLEQKYFPKPERRKRINDILYQLNEPGIQTDVRELKNLLIELRDEE